MCVFLYFFMVFVPDVFCSCVIAFVRHVFLYFVLSVCISLVCSSSMIAVFISLVRSCVISLFRPFVPSFVLSLCISLCRSFFIYVVRYLFRSFVLSFVNYFVRSLFVYGLSSLVLYLCTGSRVRSLCISIFLYVLVMSFFI